MFNLDSNTQILTIRSGDLVASRDQHLDVSDIQNGDLLVESGGFARITGILNGSITVREGGLHVIGIVNGDIAYIGGKLTFDPAAKVKGTVTNQES